MTRRTARMPHGRAQVVIEGISGSKGDELVLQAYAKLCDMANGKERAWQWLRWRDYKKQARVVNRALRRRNTTALAA